MKDRARSYLVTATTGPSDGPAVMIAELVAVFSRGTDAYLLAGLLSSDPNVRSVCIHHYQGRGHGITQRVFQSPYVKAEYWESFQADWEAASAHVKEMDLWVGDPNQSWAEGVNQHAKSMGEAKVMKCVAWGMPVRILDSNAPIVEVGPSSEQPSAQPG